MRRAWTEAELELLRDTSLSLKEVAERTGRSYQAVKSQGAARYQGVRRGRANVLWADSELAVLRDLRLTYSQVAEQTGRSLSAAEHMSIRLGLDRSFRTGSGLKKGSDSLWSLAELELLAELDLSLAEVAEQTGRSYEAVKQMAFRREIVRYDGSYVSQYRGAGWPKVRQAALERDGYSCQDCKYFSPMGSNLHVHHVIPYRLLPENRLEWLVTLCNSCHMRRPEHWWPRIPEAVLIQLAA